MWIPSLVILRKAVPVTTSSQATEHAGQPGGPAGLLARLGELPDPRGRRGRQHSYASILAVAACATAAVGDDSLTAIGEWSRRADQDSLAALGVRRDPFTGRHVPPSEPTIRRALTGLGVERLESAVGGYLRDRAPAPPRPAEPPPPEPPEPSERSERSEPPPARPAPPPTPRAAGPGTPDRPLEREQRRKLRRDESDPPPAGLAPGLAIDGKRLAGARLKDGGRVQPLSATTTHDGPALVLAQRRISDKTNEIPELKNLIKDMDLEGWALTTDALHTQRKTARLIVEDCHAHYIMFIKNNQRRLLAAAMKALAGTDDEFAATTHTDDGKDHGRTERRRVRTAPAEGTTFPHAAQFFRVLRRSGGVYTSKEVAYGVTSLTPEQAGPAALNAHTRNHWTCENKTHYVRDVTFNEDKSQVRTGSAPQALAALRNLVIGVFRLAGYANMAFARRECGADKNLILRLFNLLPNTT